MNSCECSSSESGGGLYLTTRSSSTLSSSYFSSSHYPSSSSSRCISGLRNAAISLSQSSHWDRIQQLHLAEMCISTLEQMTCLNSLLLRSREQCRDEEECVCVYNEWRTVYGRQSCDGLTSGIEGAREDVLSDTHHFSNPDDQTEQGGERGGTGGRKQTEERT